MEHPVAISILGGYLIVLFAGIACGLAARLVRRTSTFRMLVDMALGVLGGVAAIFLLPMTGLTLGNLIGWPAAVVLGAALPVAVLHLVHGRAPRRSRPPGQR